MTTNLNVMVKYMKFFGWSQTAMIRGLVWPTSHPSHSSLKKNICFRFLVLVFGLGLSLRLDHGLDLDLRLGQIENGPFTWSHCTQCAFQWCLVQRGI